MLEILHYKPVMKSIWDKFLDESANGTFLFHRDYMEYHSDRYFDESFILVNNANIVALFPCNKDKDVIISHGGLTHGGLIYKNPTTETVLTIFDLILRKLKDLGYKLMIYKTIPSTYHQIPCEQDLYALIRNNAKLIRREVSSVIQLSNFKISLNRMQGYRKAVNSGIQFVEDLDIASFLEIVNNILINKYNTRAVHNEAELKYLISKFPNNIKLFSAVFDGKLLAGAIMYINENVAHVQYLYTSEEGKKFRALDFLVINLLNFYKDKKTFFDFGKSTENEGKYLNTNLIRMKEDFGATGKVYDAYQIDLA